MGHHLATCLKPARQNRQNRIAFPSGIAARTWDLSWAAACGKGCLGANLLSKCCAANFWMTSKVSECFRWNDEELSMGDGMRIVISDPSPRSFPPSLHLSRLLSPA